jgi:hypothetical protein
MARIRSIKPEFWTDSVMVDLSIPARLLFIGMWNFTLCDLGHLPDDAKRIKLQVFPADQLEVSLLIEELLEAGRLERGLTDAGKPYLVIPKFPEHQKLDKRWSPRCYVCAGQRPDDSPGTSPNHNQTPGDSRKLPQTQPLSPQDRTGQDRTEEPPVVPHADETTAAAKKATGRKRPAKALPDDWTPTDGHVAKARELGVDGRREEEKFRAHAAANDRRQVDWNQAFTQWLLNARPSQPAARPANVSSLDEWMTRR